MTSDARGAPSGEPGAERTRRREPDAEVPVGRELDVAVPAAPRADVAVVIPCYNEAATVGKVVADFRRSLPGARILVVDNASSDGTAAAARAAGARVVVESRRGKGHALLRGFDAVRDAASVVMVDGDDTYPAEEVGALLAAVDGGADVAIGTRLHVIDEGAFPARHNFGNKVFRTLVRVLFGARTEDLFSGYRVLSRRFLDVSPLIAQGFEIETELSLQALARGFVVAEVPVQYRARPAGSTSKLSTWRDGYRILLALVAFFRDYRPLVFFGILSGVCVALSLAAGGLVVSQFVETGRVLRVPLAVLSVGLALLGAVALVGGLLLSTVNRRAAELAVLLARR